MVELKAMLDSNGYQLRFGCRHSNPNAFLTRSRPILHHPIRTLLHSAAQCVDDLILCSHTPAVSAPVENGTPLGM